jgi:hypothetical protein
MLESIKQRIFPFTIALSALLISASAAFYSVTGLSKLFAGASLEVIIMAGSLEFAKLVIASLLYQYWNQLNKFLRVYLSIATFVLILITSLGIYGFLSASYQSTSSLVGNIDAKIELLETKKSNYKQQLEIYNTEKLSLDESISDLRKGISNTIIKHKDSKTGEIISTTSNSTRKSLEKQLDQAIDRQTQTSIKIDELNQNIFDLDSEIIEIKTSDKISGELGPLKYISGLTNYSMDKIVNILLLIIIFVFDPLAIALVIAANFAFSRLKPSPSSNSPLILSDSNTPIPDQDSVIYQEQEEVIKENLESQTPFTENNLSAWRRNKIEQENKRKGGSDNTSKRYF